MKDIHDTHLQSTYYVFFAYNECESPLYISCDWPLHGSLGWIPWKTFEVSLKKNIAVVLQVVEACEGVSMHFVMLVYK
jgi:hypothetical protein